MTEKWRADRGLHSAASLFSPHFPLRTYPDSVFSVSGTALTSQGFYMRLAAAGHTRSILSTAANLYRNFFSKVPRGIFLGPEGMRMGRTYVSQFVLLKCNGFVDGVDGILISKEKKGRRKKNNKSIMALYKQQFTLYH